MLDTSVLIDLELIADDLLPVEGAVSALTLAELAAGPHATADPQERARRQSRLQHIEAAFEPLGFDAEAARAYGLVFAAVHGAGRGTRRRTADLLIAATAAAAELPLFTRNPQDVAGLEAIVEVIPV